MVGDPQPKKTGGRVAFFFREIYFAVSVEIK